MGPSGRGPPGSGGKVKLVVKSLVIEWPGLDGGLRRPIWGPPGRGPPGSGGKVKLVVTSLVIEWPGLDGGLRRPIWGPPGRWNQLLVVLSVSQHWHENIRLWSNIACKYLSYIDSVCTPFLELSGFTGMRMYCVFTSKGALVGLYLAWSGFKQHAVSVSPVFQCTRELNSGEN